MALPATFSTLPSVQSLPHPCLPAGAPNALPGPAAQLCTRMSLEVISGERGPCCLLPAGKANRAGSGKHERVSSPGPGWSGRGIGDDAQIWGMWAYLRRVKRSGAVSAEVWVGQALMRAPTGQVATAPCCRHCHPPLIEEGEDSERTGGIPRGTWARPEQTFLAILILRHWGQGPTKRMEQRGQQGQDAESQAKKVPREEC